MLARTISQVAERAATRVVPDTSPSGKNPAVAGVKHRSIFGLDMLCCGSFEEDPAMQTEKRSKRKRCMSWQMTD